jgi:uroporphyrinogen-III decarboxylase
MVMGGAEKRRASGERWRLIGNLQPEMVAAGLAVLREKGSICVKTAPAFSRFVGAGVG